MMKPIEAHFLARFLDRMLKWNPTDRPSAEQMLDDPWLKLQDDWDPYVSRHHLREIKKATNPEYTYSETTEESDESS
jgi:serine/threonine protein kinase